MLIVICGSGDDQYIPERKLSGCGWNETVKDIAEGQFSGISSIYWAATGLDVTDIIASEVMTIWADRDEGLSNWERDFIEQTLGIQAANKFRVMEPA